MAWTAECSEGAFTASIERIEPDMHHLKKLSVHQELMKLSDSSYCSAKVHTGEVSSMSLWGNEEAPSVFLDLLASVSMLMTRQVQAV